MNTSKTNQKKQPQERTFESCDELLKSDLFTEKHRCQIKAGINKFRFTLNLVHIRQEAGFSQKQFAEKSGLDLNKIIEIESGNDDDLTLKALAAYASITKKGFHIAFGEPIKKSQAVKYHYSQMRANLESLASIVDGPDDTALKEALSKFMATAAFNLLEAAESTVEHMNNLDGNKTKVEFIDFKETANKESSEMICDVK